MPIGWKQQNSVVADDNSHNNKPKNSSTVREEDSKTANFAPRIPLKKMEDLVISANVRIHIETVLNRIRFHETLYHEWNLKSIDPFGARTAINLFGLPGTGKTFCAEAIAHHLGKRIIDVNYAEIESKYVGETSKNIVEAFRQAKESGAVLFFDEADSILGKRMTNVTQSADHSVNVSRAVMLKQLDAFDGIVIFATNLAQNYDTAFVRRILAHIEFELPDKECLIKLWNYLLVKEIPVAADVSMEWLAEQSVGLSGGDLLNVVTASASRAVVRKDSHRKIDRNDITEQIEFIKNARRKIGSADSFIAPSTDGKLTVTETICDPAELPVDAQEKYREVVARSNAVPPRKRKSSEKL